jgi:hypothetical protein
VQEVVRVTIVIALGLGAAGLGVLFVVALGRAAALADEESGRLVSEQRASASLAGYRQSYEGFAWPHATLAQEPFAERSSRTSIVARRLPASSCTSPQRAHLTTR